MFMELATGTYKFNGNHLCGAHCRWCKARKTVQNRKIARATRLRDEQIAKATQRHWEKKDRMSGYVVYGAFLVSLVAVVI